MEYPIRYPFAKLMSRLGATVTIEVQANYDQEAKVFVATSRDLPGLVLEANGIDELKCELGEAIPALLKIDHKKPLRNTSADLCYRDHIAIA